MAMGRKWSQGSRFAERANPRPPREDREGKVLLYLVHDSGKARLFSSSATEKLDLIWIPISIIRHQSKVGGKLGDFPHCTLTLPAWKIKESKLTELMD